MHTPCIPVSYRAIVRVLSEVSFFSLLAVFSIHPSFIRCVSSLAYRFTPRKRACVVWASREKKLIYSCHSSLLFYVRTIVHTLFSTYYANVNLYVCPCPVPVCRYSGFSQSISQYTETKMRMMDALKSASAKSTPLVDEFLVVHCYIANVLPLHCF